MGTGPTDDEKPEWSLEDLEKRPSGIELVNRLQLAAEVFGA